MLDDAYRPRCARPFKQGNRHKTLSLTPETVKSHVKHISVKLGVEKRAQAAFYPTIGAAIAAGLPWLSFCCSTCEQFVSVDLRTLDRHPGAASLISSIACKPSTNFASSLNAKYYVASQHFWAYHALQSARRSLPSIGNPALARAGAQGGRARLLLIARPIKEPL